MTDGRRRRGSPPRDAAKADTGRRILAAAMEIFAREGYHATRMDAIARAAGGVERTLARSRASAPRRCRGGGQGPADRHRRGGLRVARSLGRGRAMQALQSEVAPPPPDGYPPTYPLIHRHPPATPAQVPGPLSHPVARGAAMDRPPRAGGPGRSDERTRATRSRARPRMDTGRNTHLTGARPRTDGEGRSLAVRILPVDGPLAWRIAWRCRESPSRRSKDARGSG